MISLSPMSNRKLLTVRRLFLVVTVCLLIPRQALSLETIRITEASDKYDFEVNVEGCGGESRNNEPNHCSGKARIGVFKKGEKTPFQFLSLTNIEFRKDSAAHNPKKDGESSGVYGQEYGLVSEDFNFDGHRDLAMCNGRTGGYGGPSYTIFLFDNKSLRFVENKQLSRLTDAPGLGLFVADTENKQLVVHAKSGCCYHETKKFRVLNNKPVLVEKVADDSTGDIRVVTTEKLIKGKWSKSVKREQLEDQEPGK